MAQFLETLVKLASAGTSGISIFVVFWCGYMVWKLPEDASPERHATLRFFMKIAFGITILSAITSASAAYWDFRTNQALRMENKHLANRVAISEESKESLVEINSQLVTQNSKLEKNLEQIEAKSSDLMYASNELKTENVALTEELEEAKRKVAAYQIQMDDDILASTKFGELESALKKAQARALGAEERAANLAQLVAILQSKLSEHR